MGAIFFREVASFFRTPVGYVYLGVSFFFSGLLFSLINLVGLNTQFVHVLQMIQVILIFSTPLLTMRLFSEERKNRTDQLLFTSAVPLFSIVFAKFFAACFLFLVTVFGMLVYPVVLEIFAAVDWLKILSAFFGYMLVGVLYTSIGVFISSLTENQVIAAFLTFCALLFLWMSEFVLRSFPKTVTAGLIVAFFLVGVMSVFCYREVRDWRVGFFVFLNLISIVGLVYFFKKEIFSSWISESLLWFSVPRRYNMLFNGMIRWGDCAYFLGLSGLFCYLTVWRLERRHWIED